ncbi:hypothetical protein [Streptomyces sp. NPDC060027]|uniref:hypothetical protein n=1 Tax=Streptomyces sp. NPDC060027 TaxID=3347040 RepID=UPI0036AB5DF1
MKKTIARIAIAFAVAVGGVVATSGTASAYGTGDCTYSKQRTASGSGDTVILQVWRCPDGHDYVKGIISGSASASHARVWLDDSINGGSSWTARQYTTNSSRSTQTPQNDLLYDGSPHKVRACGDTSGHRTICSAWY